MIIITVYAAKKCQSMWNKNGWNKGERKNLIVIIGDFNTPLSVTDRKKLELLSGRIPEKHWHT